MALENALEYDINLWTSLGSTIIFADAIKPNPAKSNKHPLAHAWSVFDDVINQNDNSEPNILCERVSVSLGKLQSAKKKVGTL